VYSGPPRRRRLLRKSRPSPRDLLCLHFRPGQRSQSRQPQTAKRKGAGAEARRGCAWAVQSHRSRCGGPLTPKPAAAASAARPIVPNTWICTVATTRQTRVMETIAAREAAPAKGAAACSGFVARPRATVTAVEEISAPVNALMTRPCVAPKTRTAT
jgi:hypothetical protein